MTYKTNTLMVKPNNGEEEKEIGDFKDKCHLERKPYRGVIMGWIEDFNRSKKLKT